MAIGFGSLGTGSTDRIQVDNASQSGSIRVIAFTGLSAGLGGGSLGRVFEQPGLSIQRINSTTMRFERSWTGVGQWTFTWALNDIGSFVVLYDGSSASNNPRVWKNGTELTVITTQAPTGSIVTLGSTLIVGNRVDNARNWDGWLARFAIWTSILSDTACASISKGFSPSKYSPSTIDFYLPMLKLGRDVSRNNRTTTVTGTAFQTHPRVLGGYR